LLLLKSTISPAAREVGPLGNDMIYTVAGVFDLQYLDATNSKIDEPIPPFLADRVQDTAGQVLSLLSDDILFHPRSPAAENLWT
jgi:hypothetical protein